MNILTSRWLPWGLVAITGLYIGYLFYAERTKQVVEKTKQTAIENPAESKKEVVKRVITRVVERTNGETERTNTVETINTATDKHPEVPNNEVSNTVRHWYLSVCAGPKIGEDYKNTYFGVGAGANIFDWLSGGLRYDDFGTAGRGRVAVELRLNF